MKNNGEFPIRTIIIETFKEEINQPKTVIKYEPMTACAKSVYEYSTTIEYNKNYLIPKPHENKLKINILYYDESLLINNMLSDYCAYIQMNIAGTFYGCHKMSLFNLISEKVKTSDREFILITSGSSAENIYSKISYIYNIREYYILCSGNEKKAITII